MSSIATPFAMVPSTASLASRRPLKPTCMLLPVLQNSRHHRLSRWVLVYCIKLNGYTRASQKVHHKAPFAGKGSSYGGFVAAKEDSLHAPYASFSGGKDVAVSAEEGWAAGDITSMGSKVTIEADEFELTSNGNIDIVSNDSLLLYGNGDATLEGTTVDISAIAIVKVTGSAGVAVTSYAVTDIQGALIQLNGSGMPAARMGGCYRGGWFRRHYFRRTDSTNRQLAVQGRNDNRNMGISNRLTRSAVAWFPSVIILTFPLHNARTLSVSITGGALSHCV